MAAYGLRRHGRVCIDDPLCPSLYRKEGAVRYITLYLKDYDNTTVVCSCGNNRRRAPRGHRPRGDGRRRHRHIGVCLRAGTRGAAGRRHAHDSRRNSRRRRHAECRRPGLPCAYGREDSAQEPLAGHRTEPAGDVFLHFRGRHRPCGIQRAPRHRRGGPRDQDTPRTAPWHRRHRLAAGHHRQPHLRRDGGSDSFRAPVSHSSTY
jgi:hypothetical protein